MSAGRASAGEPVACGAPIRPPVLVGGAVLATLVARVVVLRVRLHGGPRALLLDHERAKLDPNVAHLAPVLSPRVPDDPVLGIGRIILAPANDRDNVIDALASLVGNTTLVVQDR